MSATNLASALVQAMMASYDRNVTHYEIAETYPT